MIIVGIQFTRLLSLSLAEQLCKRLPPLQCAVPLYLIGIGIETESNVDQLGPPAMVRQFVVVDSFN